VRCCPRLAHLWGTPVPWAHWGSGVTGDANAPAIADEAAPSGRLTAGRRNGPRQRPARRHKPSTPRPPANVTSPLLAAREARQVAESQRSQGAGLARGRSGGVHASPVERPRARRRLGASSPRLRCPRSTIALWWSCGCRAAGCTTRPRATAFRSCSCTGSRSTRACGTTKCLRSTTSQRSSAMTPADSAARPATPTPCTRTPTISGGCSTTSRSTKRCSWGSRWAVAP
jgi:hypothetical protein